MIDEEQGDSVVFESTRPEGTEWVWRVQDEMRQANVSDGFNNDDSSGGAQRCDGFRDRARR
jgi:hypothetical protein